jgi:hypothetical protein
MSNNKVTVDGVEPPEPKGNWFTASPATSTVYTAKVLHCLEQPDAGNYPTYHRFHSADTDGLLSGNDHTKNDLPIQPANGHRPLQ